MSSRSRRLALALEVRSVTGRHGLRRPPGHLPITTRSPPRESLTELDYRLEHFRCHYSSVRLVTSRWPHGRSQVTVNFQLFGLRFAGPSYAVCYPRSASQRPRPHGPGDQNPGYATHRPRKIIFSLNNPVDTPPPAQPARHSSICALISAANAAHFSMGWRLANAPSSANSARMAKNTIHCDHRHVIAGDVIFCMRSYADVTGTS